MKFLIVATFISLFTDGTVTVREVKSEQLLTKETCRDTVLQLNLARVDKYHSYKCVEAKPPGQGPQD